MLNLLKKPSIASIPVEVEPTLEEIAEQWNRNVCERASELESQTDITYFDVIVPTVKALLSKYTLTEEAKIVDIGCGLGYLTYKVACWGYNIVGVDIAEKTIDFAKKRFPSVSFEVASLQEFAQRHKNKFDVCLINMTLHNLGDTKRNIEAIHSILDKNGIVIASVPHPKNWFSSRSYFNKFAHYFDYKLEKKYQLPFQIRGGEVHPSKFFYFHRPISFYEKEITHAGFEIKFSGYPTNSNGQPEKDLLFCVWKKKV